MNVIKKLIPFLKAGFGGALLFSFGGMVLVTLGITPTVALFSLIPIIGSIPATIVLAIGIYYLLIGIPVSLYGAALIDSGLSEIMHFKFGIAGIVKNGIKKLPLLGVPLSKAI
jgi:hypothetical protein